MENEGICTLKMLFRKWGRWGRAGSWQLYHASPSDDVILHPAMMNHWSVGCLVDLDWCLCVCMCVCLGLEPRTCLVDWREGVLYVLKGSEWSGQKCVCWCVCVSAKCFSVLLPSTQGRPPPYSLHPSPPQLLREIISRLFLVLTTCQSLTLLAYDITSIWHQYLWHHPTTERQGPQWASNKRRSTSFLSLSIFL